MAAPKRKWTSEEEVALRAGVEKYGSGKWQTILKDPEFAVCLASRSNVDLKDKWRNLLSVSAGGRSKTPKLEFIAAVPPFSAFPPSPAAPDAAMLIKSEAIIPSAHKDMAALRVAVSGPLNPTDGAMQACCNAMDAALGKTINQASMAEADPMAPSTEEVVREEEADKL